MCKGINGLASLIVLHRAEPFRQLKFRSTPALRVTELLVEAVEELVDAEERLSNSSSDTDEFFLRAIVFWLLELSGDIQSSSMVLKSGGGGSGCGMWRYVVGMYGTCWSCKDFALG